jgi:hypothetical protein
MNMKKTIRLTESELHNVIKESVNTILQEGFGDSFKGALKGIKMGSEEMHGQESALHQVSYGLKSACEYLGYIHQELSKNNIEDAKRICMQAYKECKGMLNDTAMRGGQTVTGQYGAQKREYRR